MLSVINDLPEHVFGVRATGEVDQDDLKKVLLPGLKALADEEKEIYYLLVLETPVENFTAGAWWQDMKAGLRHFTQWKKMAIVTDQQAVETFTDLFGHVIPGEARGFKLSELQQAISWLSLRNLQ